VHEFSNENKKNKEEIETKKIDRKSYRNFF